MASREQRLLPRIVEKDKWTVTSCTSCWPEFTRNRFQRHLLDLHVGYPLRFDAVVNRQGPGYVVVGLERRVGRKLLRFQQINRVIAVCLIHSNDIRACRVFALSYFE